MLAELVSWFMGSRDYRVYMDKADRAAHMLAKSGANFRRMKRDGEWLTFTLPLGDCASIERIFAHRHIKLECVRERGFMYLVHRYRRRPGIPIGAVLFLFILWLSEQFIWTVTVVGNDRIPAEQIVSRLETLGCGVGTYIPSIDFDWLHNQLVIDSDDLAWAAVNVRGTKATVEVRELVLPEIIIDEDTPYNLVAREDGIISYIEILRGDPVARQDELVRQGELLASGVEATYGGYRLVHARGTVLAEVKRDIRIEVPLESTRREATGAEIRDKYLNIFGISINLFGNTGNIPSEYDKIEREDRLRFFDVIEVPISLGEVIWREMAEVPVSYTEEEAKAEAYRQLREACAAVTADSELVAREVNAGLVDGAYVIECRLTVVCDIAEERPIYTDQTQG